MFSASRHFDDDQKRKKRREREDLALWTVSSSLLLTKTILEIVTLEEPVENCLSI
jgi:hypothetical protein